MAHQLHTRSTDRFPVSYPVVFGGAPFVGEGALTDLSTSGCAIACDRTVLSGSYVRLSVLLPDQSPSLAIDLGKIRWVCGQVFGVEFIRLPTVAHQQLDRIIWARFVHSLSRLSMACPAPGTPHERQY
ncbi:MAG: PilZ domain-containing protein [Nitrospira sp.]|nr:PilZ domain-containing protein [Nitrospira sp.]